MYYSNSSIFPKRKNDRERDRKQETTTTTKETVGAPVEVPLYV
jgi:hypothetical protein